MFLHPNMLKIFLPSSFAITEISVQILMKLLRQYPILILFRSHLSITIKSKKLQGQRLDK